MHVTKRTGDTRVGREHQNYGSATIMIDVEPGRAHPGYTDCGKERSRWGHKREVDAGAGHHSPRCRFGCGSWIRHLRMIVSLPAADIT